VVQAKLSEQRTSHYAARRSSESLLLGRMLRLASSRSPAKATARLSLNSAGWPSIVSPTGPQPVHHQRITGKNP
jgi:hypothetical protein